MTCLSFSERGFYNNIEELDVVIRSKFSGTAVCVGNPALRGGGLAVEVCGGTSEDVSLTVMFRSASHFPWWCPPGVWATTDWPQGRPFARKGGAVLTVVRRLKPPVVLVMRTRWRQHGKPCRIVLARCGGRKFRLRWRHNSLVFPQSAQAQEERQAETEAPPAAQDSADERRDQEENIREQQEVQHL